MNQQEEIISKLINCLRTLSDFHAPTSTLYDFLRAAAATSIESLFGKDSKQAATIAPFGFLEFPYFSMGAINSTHLFGLDELIIFSFYVANQNHYRRVADIGANIGLHTIVLNRLGIQVTAYEPDNVHFEQLKRNIQKNCQHLKPTLLNCAVSTTTGEIDFVRVLGNTTGSHIKGAKASPYGDLSEFKVQTENFKDLCQKFDLLKIDVEGHEAEILLSTSKSDWISTDAIIEVGSLENSRKIFEHFRSIDVNLFSQKIGWRMVGKLEEMPVGYKEGSLFISAKSAMPW